MTLAEQMNDLIQAGDYRRVVDLGIAASLTGRLEPEAFQALLRMTARLRSACIDLALRKADSGPEYEALEAILIEANKLTGEDMYGRRRM
ncbi:hypothetical protein [Shinella sp.]|uniref:hypothetical protein n=1 Tax=Shinella sp. TaxID=1870904 RepID=UPI0039E3BA77